MRFSYISQFECVCVHIELVFISDYKALHLNSLVVSQLPLPGNRKLYLFRIIAQSPQ